VDGPLLVLDTGSPLVSVAVADLTAAGAVLASRATVQERSSAALLDLVAAALAAAGLAPRDLAAVAALAGPGSFTGLRIGLATALGLHQALGIAATALPTLPALAAEAAAAGLPGPLVAAVDALRGDWSAQAFAARLAPLGDAVLVPAGELLRLGGGAATVAGFGVLRLAALPGWPAAVRLHEPGPLAPAAARLAALPGVVWDAALLTRPLYARPPAATLPKARSFVVRSTPSG
jgi:tRNA threonylcarbamoyladenosine biosynthesis protein TsaB